MICFLNNILYNDHDIVATGFQGVRIWFVCMLTRHCKGTHCNWVGL